MAEKTKVTLAMEAYAAAMTARKAAETDQLGSSKVLDLAMDDASRKGVALAARQAEEAEAIKVVLDEVDKELKLGKPAGAAAIILNAPPGK
jgi:hypothetical protein